MAEPFEAADDQPFGAGHDLNAPMMTMRAKVHRAIRRGTGCRLTPEECSALDFMQGDGVWWNRPRES